MSSFENLSKQPTFKSSALPYVTLYTDVLQCFFNTVFGYTRPKPVERDEAFSMAVGTLVELLKLVPFLLGDVQLIREGGLAVF